MKHTIMTAALLAGLLLTGCQSQALSSTEPDQTGAESSAAETTAAQTGTDADIHADAPQSKTEPTGVSAQPAEAAQTTAAGSDATVKAVIVEFPEAVFQLLYIDQGAGRINVTAV